MSSVLDRRFGESLPVLVASAMVMVLTLFGMSAGVEAQDFEKAQRLAGQCTNLMEDDPCKAVRLCRRARITLRPETNDRINQLTAKAVRACKRRTDQIKRWEEKRAAREAAKKAPQGSSAETNEKLTPALQRVVGTAGQWARGVDFSKAPAPIFSEFFLVVSNDGYTSTGAIVTGLKWDFSSAPMWKTVHGHALDDGEWYISSSRLVHLGKRLTPAMRQTADSLTKSVGEDLKGMQRFNMSGRDIAAWRAGEGKDVVEGQAAPTPTTRRGSLPADAQALVDQVGRWAGSVNFNGPEAPVFKQYFMVINGDEYIATGSIVTGAVWDNSNIPGFQTVYGHAQDDGQWYVIATDLALLGPTLTPRHKELADAIFKQSGANISGMRRFEMSDGDMARLRTRKAPTPTPTPRRGGGSLPADAQAIKGQAGQWTRGVNFSGPEAPVFKQYFMVINGDEYIATGSIVTGAVWDNSDIPGFQTVHGYAQTDGQWYVIATDLTLLGPTVTARHREISTMLTKASGEDTSGMARFAATDAQLRELEARRGGGVAPTEEPKAAVPRGNLPGDALVLMSRSGKWAEGMNFSGPAPPVFKHFFLVTKGDSYIATGAIVTGAKWDNSSSPAFQTVYGFSKDDGEWYASAANLVYLGSSVTRRHVEIADILMRNAGQDVSSMRRFDGKAP